ncbi:MAG: hypothetical protein HKN21_14985, partial [Candidatus Eisenbacteria bacterium]|nr:hypothetical protein [Candidatus Eisenbacteria bacterium]
MRQLLGVAALFVVTGCSSSPESFDQDIPFKADVMKWRYGATAAASVTYDAPIGRSDHMTEFVIMTAVNQSLSRGVPIDLELVTWNFDDPAMEETLEWMRTVRPLGVHFFGHGHRHIDYDRETYETALHDFSLCFDLMEQWDLKPRSYAYPRGAADKDETRQACAEAGFFSGRTVTREGNFYITPNDQWEPEDWYYLPSVAMAHKEPNHIAEHKQLTPILDKTLDQTAWVIVTYHNIALPQGWGWYPIQEFQKDLQYLVDKDFWCDNMDDVAAYIYERNAFNYEAARVSENAYELRVFDGLDNETYDQPLTVKLRFDP